MDGYLKKFLLILIFVVFQEVGAIQFRFLGNPNVPLLNGLVGPLPAGMHIGADGLWWGNALYEAGVTTNHEVYQRIAQILARDEGQLQVFFVGGPNAVPGVVFNLVPNDNAISQVHLSEPIGNPVLTVAQPIEVLAPPIIELPEPIDLGANDMDLDVIFPPGAGAAG